MILPVLGPAKCLREIYLVKIILVDVIKAAYVGISFVFNNPKKEKNK